MQKIRRRKFGEILIAEGVITQEQLSAALERQRQTGETIGEILHDLSIVTENEIVRAICIQYQLPFIRLTSYELTPALVNRFDVTFLYRYRLVPLDVIGPASIVALGEIPPVEVEKALRKKLGEHVYFYFAPSSEVETVLREHFSLGQEDILAINKERNALHKRGQEPAASLNVPDQQLLETLDSSWESIFDEAQKNVERG